MQISPNMATVYTHLYTSANFHFVKRNVQLNCVFTLCQAVFCGNRSMRVLCFICLRARRALTFFFIKK